MLVVHSQSSRALQYGGWPLPRQADPELEKRILDAACRLWSRGGAKALTMRGVANAAGTTPPTLYERYPDPNDILRGVRLQTRAQLFPPLSQPPSLPQPRQPNSQFPLAHT